MVYIYIWYLYIFIYDAKHYSDSTFFNVHKSVPSGNRKSGHHAPSWSDLQMARPARACRIKDGESTPTIMAQLTVINGMN